MGSLASALRGAIISPEMLVVSVTAYLVINTPASLAHISRAIAAGPEAVKYLALAPVGIAVWCVAESKAVLLPTEDRKAMLQAWPRYPDLKYRIAVGLCFQALFALAAFSAWVYSPTFANPKSLIVASMGVFGSLFVGATFLMASIYVRGVTKRASA